VSKRLEEIDPNLKAVPLKDGLCFADVRATAARVHGLAEGEFVRLPAPIRALANEKLLHLQTNTSGGRVRLVTNSRRLGFRLQLADADGLPHMAYSGYAGVDCYAGAGTGSRYLATRWPDLGSSLLSSEVPLTGRWELVTLYLPLYDGLVSLELGVEPGASILPPPPCSVEPPIVFYGSSITQGGCASRPSNTYCALVSRWLDSDFRSLGFSGCAKGDLWMADYIAGLPMSCFVYDYDHNSPSPENLRQTHRPFLEVILDRNPDLPVVVMSKPNPDLTGPDRERRDIVRETCEWAKARGARVWFVDGDTLLGTEGRENCTVDGIHPNDLGFWRMAKAVYPCLKAALGQ